MFVLLDFIGPLFEMNQYDSRQYRSINMQLLWKLLNALENLSSFHSSLSNIPTRY